MTTTYERLRSAAWLAFWIIGAFYFAVAAIGGSIIGAIMSVMCGFKLGMIYSATSIHFSRCRSV